MHATINSSVKDRGLHTKVFKYFGFISITVQKIPNSPDFPCFLLKYDVLRVGLVLILPFDPRSYFCFEDYSNLMPFKHLLYAIWSHLWEITDQSDQLPQTTDVTTNLPSSGHMNLHLSLLQFLSWLPAINTWLNHLSFRSVMQGATQMHKRITHTAINFKKAKMRNLMYKRSVSAVSIAGINDIKISHGLSLMDFVFLLSA